MKVFSFVYATFGLAKMLNCMLLTMTQNVLLKASNPVNCGLVTQLLHIASIACCIKRETLRCPLFVVGDEKEVQ